MNQPATVPSLDESATSYIAYIGIDWADQKHDICLYDPATGEFEFSVIGSQPEAILFQRHFVNASWSEGLRKRFNEGAIALCTEQKQ